MFDDGFLMTFEEDEDEFGEADEHVARSIFSKREEKRDGQSGMGADDATIAEAEIAGSFLSATFSTIQPLDSTRSILIMVIQCHPTTGQRFTNATLTCHFRGAPHLDNTSGKVSKARVISIAPQYSQGGETEEQVRVAWGGAVPVQAGVPGANATLEVAVQREKQKAVVHAMTMQGTIRANGTRCTWTVEENESSEQGILPQFQVAMVVNHQGPFVMAVDVKAALKGKGRLWPTYLRAKRELGRDDKGYEKTIDIEAWKRGEVVWEDSEKGWKKFMAGFTGEVLNSVHEFTQSVHRP